MPAMTGELLTENDVVDEAGFADADGEGDEGFAGYPFNFLEGVYIGDADVVYLRAGHG